MLSLSTDGLSGRDQPVELLNPTRVNHMPSTGKPHPSRGAPSPTAGWRPHFIRERGEKGLGCQLRAGGPFSGVEQATRPGNAMGAGLMLFRWQRNAHLSVRARGLSSVSGSWGPAARQPQAHGGWHCPWPGPLTGDLPACDDLLITFWFFNEQKSTNCD